MCSAVHMRLLMRAKAFLGQELCTIFCSQWVYLEDFGHWYIALGAQTIINYQLMKNIRESINY